MLRGQLLLIILVLVIILFVNVCVIVELLNRNIVCWFRINHCRYILLLNNFLRKALLLHRDLIDLVRNNCFALSCYSWALNLLIDSRRNFLLYFRTLKLSLFSINYRSCICFNLYTVWLLLNFGYFNLLYANICVCI